MVYYNIYFKKYGISHIENIFEKYVFCNSTELNAKIMKAVLDYFLILLLLCISSLAIGQTIKINPEMKDFFPVYKKKAELREGCISGDCNNGEGVYFRIKIWSKGDERSSSRATRHVYLQFYTGKFEDNGQTFNGKKYVHFTTVEYKAANNKRNDFERAENLDLSRYLNMSAITDGVAKVEGSMINNTHANNTIREYMPDGECTIRFLRYSSDTQPYAQLKGLFSKGKPEYVDITRYQNKTELKANLFSGRAISIEMYREGKLYSNTTANSNIADSTSYYMGELLGNIRHGRGFVSNNGVITQDGFWFLNKPVDMSMFKEEDFIDYHNIQKATLDNVDVLEQKGQYSGTIKDNKPHGFGTFTNKWFTYHGYFKDGLPEGVGSYTLYEPKSGGGNVSYEVKTFVGTFKSGKANEGKMAYVSVYRSQDYIYFSDIDVYSGYIRYYVMNGHIYSGTFNKYGLLEGNGSIDGISFYQNTDVRTNDYRITSLTYGNFKNNSLHGVGYTDVAGFVKQGIFENGQLVNGSTKEDYSRLKQGDVINIGGNVVYVTQSYKNWGGWTVELSNKQKYNYNFEFTRSTKNYRDFLDHVICTSCKGGGTHTRKVKENYLPSYSVERSQLVTTTVITTKYTHAKAVTYDIVSKCEQCNGTGKVISIKKQLN